MKLKEKEELLKKIAELQKQVDNAVIENDNPYDVKDGEKAYYTTANYKASWYDCWTEEEAKEYVACKDEDIIKKRSKREYLNALLEKFAYENDAVVTEDMWNNFTYEKYRIFYDYYVNKYEVVFNFNVRELNVIYFRSEEVAERAINEVVIPFMEGKDE